MSATATELLEVHTDDALAYARTIHGATSSRERQALAAVHSTMPSSISEVARVSGMSRRTAQRALEALADDSIALLERTPDGYTVRPFAIGGVDAWVHHYAHESASATVLEEGSTAALRKADGDADRFTPDVDGWPEDSFPAERWEPSEAEIVETARRAVDARRVPYNRGTFVPFYVLDYVSETSSLQAAKVALECGRRADRRGVATFGRGELARLLGMSGGQLTGALSRLRQDGMAVTTSPQRVELRPGRAQGVGTLVSIEVEKPGSELS